MAVPLLCSNTHAGNPSTVSGEAIYDAYCGTCHGFNGAPLLPNTPNFAEGERMEKSDSELLDFHSGRQRKSNAGMVGCSQR